MKKRRNLLLTAILAVSLLCGCTQETPVVAETVPPEPEAAEPVVRVETVDELLAAIAPDANIELAAQTFDLSAAADYGKETDSPYYSWKSWDKPFALVLDSVDGLTICSTGEATLLADGGIRLQNCDNVHLEGFSMESTAESGLENGIWMAGCEDGVLRSLTLRNYHTGMMLDLSNRIQVEQCQLERCGWEGIHASTCRDLEISQCGLSQWKQAGTALALYDCRNVSLRDSVVTECRVETLFSSSQSRNVTLQNCTITDNQVRSNVFDVYDQEAVTLDACTFSGNRIAQWLQWAPMGEDERVWMQDAAGTPLTEADLQKLQPEQGSLPEQKEIRVDTVDAFLQAIGPDTAVILEAPLYDLSQAADYGQSGQSYYYWEETFDGPQLVICNVENFSIRSAENNRDSCTISALPRYADVLTFRNCRDITVSGITAGHTREPGECVGGVLNASACVGITVENCGLFGCGILGLQTDGCKGVTVKDCDIYECSQGGIWMSNTDQVAIDGCTFRDLGGEPMLFGNCTQVLVDGEKMPQTDA